MNRVITLVVVAIFALVVCGCSQTTTSDKPSGSSGKPASTQQVSSSNNRTSATADTVFGFPDQRNVKSGSGGNIGTVSVFHANSSDCTEEKIEKWCNQYLRWSDDNWCAIEFSDKPGYGVYASGSVVESGVKFASDYSIDSDAGALLYVFTAQDVTADGRLSGPDQL